MPPGIIMRAVSDEGTSSLAASVGMREQLIKQLSVNHQRATSHQFASRVPTDLVGRDAIHDCADTAAHQRNALDNR